jgi:hypothetical protein
MRPKFTTGAVWPALEALLAGSGHDTQPLRGRSAAGPSSRMSSGDGAADGDGAGAIERHACSAVTTGIVSISASPIDATT